MSYYDLPGVRFRPIERWPGRLLRWSQRRRSQVSASWPKTIALLNRELSHLGAKQVVLQVAMTERDIRLDGYPRANARAEHPGVILAFDSIHGPLQYAVDTFDHWQDNIRAIALALEALRAVDRYGVTRHGEQYRGWKAIEAPANGKMTVEQAARFIAEQADSPLAWPEVVADTGGRARRDAYRRAAAKLHPDAGGPPDLFIQLQQAKRVLDQHGGGR